MTSTTNGHSATNGTNGTTAAESDRNSSPNKMDTEPDLVMMTPLKKELDHTILRVERVSRDQMNKGSGSETGARHVAGGQHQGIIVNKQLVNGTAAGGSDRPFDLRLAFKVFLINAITQIHQQESRELRFWFSEILFENGHSEENGYADRMHCAQAFFRALVNPTDFPKNYVGFIMKLMKTMQQPVYRPLVQIELEVRSVDEPFERPPSSVASRPCKYPMQQSTSSLFSVDPCTRCQFEDSRKLPDLIQSINATHEKNTDRIQNCIPKSASSQRINRGPPPPIPPKPKIIPIRLETLSHSISLGSVDENSIAALIPLTEEKVLEMIEAAYPNPLSLADIAIATRSKEEEVHHLVVELTSKGVARFTDSGDFVVRVTSDETKVKRVRQMPEVVRSQQPTIAIITAQFCEKLAVDAMIENKDTYVRYKVEGESNVYTLGNIGPHRVVATKLPAVGNSRSAMIAAGNTTTRLLGTFQRVEYVFLVGIGGGVPHYTDYRQHVRLGDVVVSSSPKKSAAPPISPQNGNGSSGGIFSTTGNRSDYVYVHCEKLRSSPDEPLNASNSAYSKLQTVDSFNYRFWCPYSLELQDIAKRICAEAAETGVRPWEQYLQEARGKLMESDDLDFVRPDASTDKLYMSIGTNDLIEMAHPEPDPNSTSEEMGEYDPRAVGMPKVHFGPIGAGRMAVGNEQLRQDIALKYGIKAFDIEFDTVIESIFGNRKDRYMIIRGIADYKDGARKKEWQPYAALSAAAFMKAILCRLEPMPANY